MISYLNTLKYLLNKNNWDLILGLNSNECYMENVYFLDNFSNKDREDSGQPVVACIYINKITRSIKNCTDSRNIANATKCTHMYCIHVHILLFYWWYPREQQFLMYEEKGFDTTILQFDTNRHLMNNFFYNPSQFGQTCYISDKCLDIIVTHSFQYLFNR